MRTFQHEGKQKSLSGVGCRAGFRAAWGAAVMLVAMLRPDLDRGWCIRGLSGDRFRR